MRSNAAPKTLQVRWGKATSAMRGIRPVFRPVLGEFLTPARVRSWPRVADATECAAVRSRCTADTPPTLQGSAWRDECLQCVDISAPRTKAAPVCEAALLMPRRHTSQRAEVAVDSGAFARRRVLSQNVTRMWCSSAKEEMSWRHEGSLGAAAACNAGA
jgi:hypothetical protein